MTNRLILESFPFGKFRGGRNFSHGNLSKMRKSGNFCYYLFLIKCTNHEKGLKNRILDMRQAFF